MNEKLVAGIVTAAAIAPICTVCVFGPAAVGAVLAGAFGWIGGISGFGIAALIVIAAGVVHVLYRRSGRRRQTRCGREDAAGEEIPEEVRSRLPDERVVRLPSGRPAFDGTMVLKELKDR